MCIKCLLFKEILELAEKHAKEREEAELAPHKREGWMTDKYIKSNQSLMDVDDDLITLRNAILSLQTQIDELKEIFE